MLCTKENFDFSSSCLKDPRRRSYVPVGKKKKTLAPNIMSIRKGIAPTHPDCTRATKLSLQSTLKLPREGGLVGIVEIDNTSNAKERCDESANHDQAWTGRSPSVLPRRKHAENIVVFVYRFTKVSSLLGIPPVGVGITELSLDSRGVDVAAILYCTQV